MGGSHLQIFKIRFNLGFPHCQLLAALPCGFLTVAAAVNRPGSLLPSVVHLGVINPCGGSRVSPSRMMRSAAQEALPAGELAAAL